MRLGACNKQHAESTIRREIGYWADEKIMDDSTLAVSRESIINDQLNNCKELPERACGWVDCGEGMFNG